MAGNHPQAVFVPTEPLENQSTKNRILKRMNANQIKKLRELLSAAINAQTGWGQFLASPVVTKKYVDEDMIQEVENLNWLYPEIVPHKFGVKRRQNVSQEYRVIVQNLKKQRMGLGEFPTINENSIPQLAKINSDRVNFVPLLSGKNSVLEFMLDEIENQNPLIQTERESYFGKTGVASSNNKQPSKKKSQASAGQAVSGGANSSTGSSNNTSALGRGTSSKSDSGAVKSGFGSYRDLNISHSSYGVTGSSLGSLRSNDLASGSMKGLNPFQLPHEGSSGYIRSYRASKNSMGGNQGIAGSHFGSLIAVIASSPSLWGGDLGGHLFRGADFMKQPCVRLFKAVDPPPWWMPLAEVSSG